MSKFAQTYAPTSFDQLVFADDNVERLLRDYATGARTKSIILHGPYGTGKSIVAQMILQTRVGANYRACETVNGANYKESRFIKRVENSINYLKMLGIEDHVAVIDEADLMDKRDQLCLRASMDTFGGMFILTTNFLHSIDQSLLDRSDVIHMEIVPAQRLLPVAQRILRINGLVWDDARVLALLQKAGGNWRRMMQLLEDVVQATKRSAA